VVGRHPTTGEVVDLVPRELATEAQRLQGEATGKRRGKGAQGSRKKGREKAQRREAVRAMERLFQAIAGRGITSADLLALVATELEESPDAMSMFRLWLRLDGEDEMSGLLTAMETHALDESVAPGTPRIQINLAYVVCAVLAYNLYWRGAKDAAFQAFAVRYGVDLTEGGTGK